MKRVFKPVRIVKTYTVGEKELHTDPHFEVKNKVRKIPIPLILETFSNPKDILPSSGYTNAHAYIKDHNGRGMKVVVKDDRDPLILITAHWID